MELATLLVVDNRVFSVNVHINTGCNNYDIPRNACNAFVSPSRSSVRNEKESITCLLRKNSLTLAYARSCNTLPYLG